MQAVQHGGSGVIGTIFGVSGLVLDQGGGSSHLDHSGVDLCLDCLRLILRQIPHARAKRVNIGLHRLDVGPGGLFDPGDSAADLFVKRLDLIAGQRKRGLQIGHDTPFGLPFAQQPCAQCVRSMLPQISPRPQRRETPASRVHGGPQTMKSMKSVAANRFDQHLFCV